MNHPPASRSLVKRNRSNTHDYASSAPQTEPPHLRSNLDASNIGLYSPAAYNATYGRVPSSPHHTTYGQYQQPTGQPNPYGGDYTAAGYGESYDSQGQANGYAVAFGQPSPNAQNALHGASYPQGAVDNTHSGPFMHTEIRQTVLAGTPTYSPLPGMRSSQNTNYPEISGRGMTPLSRQGLSQYGESFSSQPAHTTAYHTNSASYPEPTVNAQYSPQPPFEQTSGTDALPSQFHNDPSVEENGEEDAQGEAIDEANEVHLLHHSIPEGSEDDSQQGLTDSALDADVNDEPTKPQENRCACKKGRGKKKACISCACSKYGRMCGAHCSCGDACGNPFQDLTTFFGPADKFPKPCEANACFATWLSNQPNIEELDVDLMVDMLLYDDNSWAETKTHNKAFKEWEEKWLKAKNAKVKRIRESREKLEFELLRGALGNCNADDFHGFWYSFCRGQWVPTDLWDHCRECQVCAPSSDWHCLHHGQHTTNGSCPGCTGVAAAYPEA